MIIYWFDFYLNRLGNKVLLKGQILNATLRGREPLDPH